MDCKAYLPIERECGDGSCPWTQFSIGACFAEVEDSVQRTAAARATSLWQLRQSGFASVADTIVVIEHVIFAEWTEWWDKEVQPR
jgi:hypothetical protein